MRLEFFRACFFLYVFFLLVLPGSYSISQSVNSSIKTETLECQLFDLVNKERKKVGLALFVNDDLLRKVARQHSADMEKRNFFSHINLRGDSPFDRMRKAEIEYTKAAENIAYNATVLKIHESLMKSKGHRKNILNPQLGKVGIGIVYSKYGLMTTELFKNPD